MRISDWSSDVCSSDLLADHGDMADRHGTAGREGKDGADAGFMAALIAALGLAPPAIGVAVKLDAGNLPGEGHALQDAGGGRKSEGRRVGKAWVRTCSARWWPYH